MGSWRALSYKSACSLRGLRGKMELFLNHLTAGEIEGLGEEEADGRSTVDICHNVLTIFVILLLSSS